MTTLLWVLRVLVILLAAYCFLAAPNLLHRKLSHRQLTGHDYAHRGLHDKALNAPENSPAAFARAVRAGYGIELDVRLTRDHALVVHHDATLERSCGDKRRVCDVPLAELQKMPLFGTSEHIPTLDEVLDIVDGRVPLIVELKTDFYQKHLAQDVFERLRKYPGVYCVESFDPMAVRWFKKNAPDVVRGQLAMTSQLKGLRFADKVKRVLLGFLLVDFLGRPDFIAYGYETDANPSFRFVAKVFRPLLVAWTVRDAETCRALRQEYDLLIFERFRAARDA